MEKTKGTRSKKRKIRVYADAGVMMVDFNLMGLMCIASSIIMFCNKEEHWAVALCALLVGLLLAVIGDVSFFARYVELNCRSRTLTIKYAWKKTKQAIDLDRIIKFYLWVDKWKEAYTQIEVIGKGFSVHTDFSGLTYRSWSWRLRLRRRRFQKFVLRANDLLAAMRLQENKQ